MTVSDYIKAMSERIGRRIRVGLIGYGITNRSVFERLDPLLCDVCVRCPAYTKVPQRCRSIFGVRYMDGIDEDIIFLSPSVRADHPALTAAAECGVEITSECEVFFTRGEANTSYPLVMAVSGSDGKTTVTSMAAQMLDAVAVGNIGVPYSQREGERRYVAELSSFNLNSFQPYSDAAVITSLSPNHLDWHRDLSEYYSAKGNLLNNTARAVISADGDSLSLSRGGETLFSVRYTRKELERLGALHTVNVCEGNICYDGEPIIPLDSLSVRETHNISNLLAAIGLCHGYCDTEKIKEVAHSFRPPRHRGERVHTSKGGVCFIDSSIDTTPTRTATTLLGLNRRVLLLLGGRGKGLPFAPLTDALAKYAKGIAIYGDVGEEIYSFISGSEELCGIPCGVYKSFSDALGHLCKIAGNGDTVLLSPSATAYGEFENYEKRGDFFAEYVRKNCP